MSTLDEFWEKALIEMVENPENADHVRHLMRQRLLIYAFSTSLDDDGKHQYLTDPLFKRQVDVATQMLRLLDDPERALAERRRYREHLIQAVQTSAMQPISLEELQRLLLNDEDPT